jgi:chromosome segregation ATPase
LHKSDLSVIEDKKEILKQKKQINDLSRENSDLLQELAMYKEIINRQNKEIEQLNRALSDVTIELSTRHEEIQKLQEEVDLQAEQRLSQMEKLNKTRDRLQDVNAHREQIEVSAQEKDLEIQTLVDRLTAVKNANSMMVKEKDNLVASLDQKRHEVLVIVTNLRMLTT